MRKNTIVQQIVIIAFLIAMEIILTRFLSINLPILRIGFGFLPVAICAILYGPVWAGIGYAIGDVLGMLIWPSGPYFPGFTLTAFLVGLTYGLILYRKEISWPRVSITACTVIVLFTVFLNTLWISILYGKGFVGLLPTRLAEAAVMIPIQILLIKLVYDKVLTRIPLAREILDR